jgi:hypothetical protein
LLVITRLRRTRRCARKNSDHRQRGQRIGGQGGKPGRDEAPREKVRGLRVRLEPLPDPLDVRLARVDQVEATSHVARVSKACAHSQGNAIQRYGEASCAADTLRARRVWETDLAFGGPGSARVLGGRGMIPRMARLSSAEVFTPTSFPTHTYVQRDHLHHERLLNEWIRSATQIASVSGPSKAGKTVLVQRVVGEDNLITVSGGSVRSADQLWERVLDWWGEPHSTTATTAEAATETRGHEKGLNLGIPGTGVGGKHSVSSAHVGTDTTSATVNRRGLPQVVHELANSPYTILLDDFHYIPSSIQSDVAQQLKDAASRGVRICVASVPVKADNLVRALPELRGRVLGIDLDYWNQKDLVEIAKLGCPLLGLEVDHASLQMFAAEAAGSPQLMQTICLWMCNHLGMRETLDTPRAVQLDELGRKEILFLTSLTADFRTLVRAMISGPRARPGERRAYVHRDGRVADVYLSIMRAVAMDPPRLTIDYADLQQRLEVLCKGACPDGASIVNACSKLGQIASGFASFTGPSFEWDDQAQLILLPDPYLLFYLRWSVVLEREADALM